MKLVKINKIDFFCDPFTKKIILKYGYLLTIKSFTFFIYSENPIINFGIDYYKTKEKVISFYIESNTSVFPVLLRTDNQVFFDISNPKLLNYKNYSDICHLANLKEPCKTKDSLSDQFIKNQETFLKKVIKNPIYLDVLYNYSNYGDNLNSRIKENLLSKIDNIRVNILDKLISLAPKTDFDYKVFRGVNSDIFYFDTKKTFISTSILNSVGKQFSNEKLFLDIVIPKNINCLLIFLFKSTFQTELELLLSTKSQFKIEILKKNKKGIDLFLKVI